MSIADNVARIRERMVEAAVRAGRKDLPKLVAATKTRTADEVRQVILAGVDACGENRVQELTQKLEENAYEGSPLHLIGTLQRNKVKYVVGKTDLIESVNSVALMDEIEKTAQKLGVTQNVLLEVNLVSEQSKTGADLALLEQMLEHAASCERVRVCGLMAIPPIAPEGSTNRPFFAQMYKLFVDTGSKKYDNVKMDMLSMGMSDDFEDAIMEGALAVRIGTALFGPRG